MICRLPICSSAAAALLSAASVTGSVTLSDSRSDSVNKRRDYSGVVVSLQPVGQPASVSSAKRATMLQKDKVFLPHVLPVTVGSFVDFPNADPIFHNAFSSYNGQVFDVGLYPPGSSRSVRFARPGAVRVFCNIHPTMSAVILVLATPYFATTKKDGTFQVDAPPGTYDLSVFHERATEQTMAKLTQRVVVGEGGIVVQPIQVSEAGFLLAAHKNKYGKDYAAPVDDKSYYPGVRQ